MELNLNNYFSREADEEYMSVSQFKAFEKCEAAALAKVRGEYKEKKTSALMIGSFVDAEFGGTSFQFALDHPEMFNSRTGELKSEFKLAYRVVERLKQDEMFMHYATGGKEQVVMTGEIEGVKFKIAIDNLHSDKIVDRKVMKDFEPIYVAEQGRLPWFEAWRYDLQGAVYQEIVLQNLGVKLPFFLAAGTKEDEPDLDIIEIGDDLLEFELEQVKKKAPRYAAIKLGIIEPDRCEKCAYCKRTKVLTRPTLSKEYCNE